MGSDEICLSDSKYLENKLSAYLHTFITLTILKMLFRFIVLICYSDLKYWMFLSCKHKIIIINRNKHWKTSVWV